MFYSTQIQPRLNKVLLTVYWINHPTGWFVLTQKQPRHQIQSNKIAPTPLHFCLMRANPNSNRYFVDDYLSMQHPENKKEAY
jgi:hypothetical protein